MSNVIIFCSEPTGLQGPHLTTSITTTNHNTSQHRLHIPLLSPAVHHYYQATSRHKSYQAAIHQYLTFCDQIKQTSMPTNEYTLLLYICSSYGKKGLSHSTIRVYLSAIRNLHVAKGQHNLDLICITVNHQFT